MFNKKLGCHPNLIIVKFNYLVEGVWEQKINQLALVIILTLKKLYIYIYIYIGKNSNARMGEIFFDN
jgi:hypothetical protein